VTWSLAVRTWPIMAAARFAAYARAVESLLTRARRVATDRDAGASELLARLLPLLADTLSVGAASTIAVSRMICEGQPAMAPLWNACAAAVADRQQPGRFAHVRAHMERAPAALARAAAQALREMLGGASRRTLLTMSYSRSVADTVRALLREAPPFQVHVICGEGRPRYEGRRMVMELAAAGAEVTLTSDAAMTATLDTSAAVLSGADAFSATHWVNKVGTRGVAAAAWLQGVPLYVIASRDKAQSSALAHRWSSSSGPAGEILPEPLPRVGVANPYFEQTAIDLATLFLTDAGPVPPADLPHVAERYREDIALLLRALGPSQA
jgi:translation initiation factor 2B subunit (eIF-2B alpha/beta/delta family)